MDKNFILSIVNAVLTVALIVIMVIMFMSVNKVASSLAPEETEITEEEIQAIPYADKEFIKMDGAMIINVSSAQDPEIKKVLRLKANIVLNTKDEDYSEIQPQVSEQDLMKSFFNSFFRLKSAEEIDRPDSQAVFEKEALEELKEKYGTKAIIEVFFSDYFSQ